MSGVAVAPSASAARAPECNVQKAVVERPGPAVRGSVRVPAVGTWQYSVLYCSLLWGDSGTGVATLQATLNHCYGRNLEVDGNFGDLTRTALKYAQGRAGVAQDGVYGPNTRDRMAHWSGGAYCARIA
ncbi:peptidoglycan-binding protein [Isoptericola sp. 4D.3]|uniref:Peptidoglycan-binding protein n=1 Tax=Isoptericola peretonis TaxID=2918523 RepID=A0ABT0J3R7_9MICO|nr:peptidoglycan-binding protein [Isoptericola sp. 4D.3]